MDKHLQDQRGVAMIIELVLVVAVLGMVGFALYANSQAKKPAAVSTTQSAIMSTPAPTPNGNVDNSVKALTQSSTSESSAVDTESSTASAGSDGNSSAASDLGGSYDENSF